MKGVIILATPCTESLGGGSGVTRTWDKDLTVDGRSMNRMPTSNHRTLMMFRRETFKLSSGKNKKRVLLHLNFVRREHGSFFWHLSDLTCQSPCRLSSVARQWRTVGATCLHTLVRALVA